MATSSRDGVTVRPRNKIIVVIAIAVAVVAAVVLFVPSSLSTETRWPFVASLTDTMSSGWWLGSDSDVTLRGTTSVAALYLQRNTTATAQQVRDVLFANTTKGIVTSSKTTNNHLLFTNY